jgi:transposase
MTSIDKNNLPNDLETSNDALINLMDDYEDMSQKYKALEAKHNHLLRAQYAKKSERFIDPDQQTLFDEMEEDDVDAILEEDAKKAPPKRHAHGRRKISEDTLPRQEVIHDVPEGKKKCSECFSDMKEIGEDIFERYEHTPASYHIERHVKKKYSCDCGQCIVTAKMPKQPIDKGIAGPGLIADVAISKFCDHQPLYRQSGIMERSDLHMPASTLWNIELGGARALEPLYELMKRDIKKSFVIQMDETFVKRWLRRKENPKGQGLKDSYFWCWRGDENHPYVLFDYSMSRSGKIPIRLLDGFNGYLQTDGYAVYDSLHRNKIVIRLACLAHIRRKFKEAYESGELKSAHFLNQVKLLYDIEAECRESAVEIRHEKRQSQSKPIIEGLEEWLIQMKVNELPQSGLRKAVNYALGQWDAFKRYLGDGRFEIDNNLTENEVRPVALGRKNYLFISSEEGGRCAAIYYSLIRSAKRNGHEPYAYLKDVLSRIKSTPNKRLKELLPQNWVIN